MEIKRKNYKYQFKRAPSPGLHKKEKMAIKKKNSKKAEYLPPCIKDIDEVMITSTGHGHVSGHMRGLIPLGVGLIPLQEDRRVRRDRSPWPLERFDSSQSWFDSSPRRQKIVRFLSNERCHI